MNRVGVTNVEMSEREQMRLLDKKKKPKSSVLNE